MHRGNLWCIGVGVGIWVAAAACSLPDEPAVEVPSWDELRNGAERVVDGNTIYVVEWDLALTLEELRDYYARHVADPGTGVARSDSTVNQVGGRDDVWTAGEGLRLTYCISNDFGGRKARAVNEMAAATRAWEAAGNVSFRHVPGHDAACTNANSAVSFAVRPWTGGGACAFFPSGGGCVARTLVIDYDDLDTNPFYATNAPNVRTVGVFRHELGHILGLRHEHTRPNSGVCVENSSWRAVTTYDSGSTMHYPWCNGVLTSDLSITELDRQGIQLLYPFDFSSGRDPDEEVDLNGDGRADVCGRGGAGIYCALSTGAGFGPVSLWVANFSDGFGWAGGPQYSSTIRFPDVNGDGRADACGRGGAGIYCALNTGGSFGPLSLWIANYSDGFGWASGPEYYATIRFPDVNGDGRADVCGRGEAGIWCAPSTGAAFGPMSLWVANYSDGFGWAAGPEYYSTIRFPDVNGDGRADVCGRGGAGIYCAPSTGASFGPVSLWIANYSDGFGWNGGPEYYGTIRFPDVNGDGRADVCGRGGAGIYCAPSTGAAFGPITLWVANYSDGFGWRTGPQYYATIQFDDITGDGRADVCGRGEAGIWCAPSTGAGFGPVSLWVANYSDGFGWSSGPQYYSTIRLADVTGDGRADVCGRGGAGIYCAPSTGASFAPISLWVANYSDGFGWAAGPQYYSTIRFP